MSIDIAYFAFNRERADAKWVQLENVDLEGIAEAHETKCEIEHQLRELRTKQYESKSARSYLKSRGIEEPSELLLTNTEMEIERGDIEWAGISDEETQKEQERLEQRLQELPKIPQELEGSNLIYNLWPREITLPWLDHTFASQKDLRSSLSELDLQLGSVSVFLTEPRWEEQFLTMLFRIFFPEMIREGDENVQAQLKEKIVLLFERMSRDKIYAAFDDPTDLLEGLDIYQNEISWLPDALVDFAQEIRPIAKDIKDHGSRLIMGGDGSERKDDELAHRSHERLASLLKRFPWISERLHSSGDDEDEDDEGAASMFTAPPPPLLDPVLLKAYDQILIEHVKQYGSKGVLISNDSFYGDMLSKIDKLLPQETPYDRANHAFDSLERLMAEGVFIRDENEPTRIRFVSESKNKGGGFDLTSL